MTADTGIQPGNSPGVVDVRLSGDEASVTGLAAALGTLPGVKVLTQSGPPSLSHHAVRLYLTVLITPAEEGTTP